VKGRASKTSLRAYSKAEPWNELEPDFVTTSTCPTMEPPDSAVNKALLTRNSAMASSDISRRLLSRMFWLRMLVASIPSTR
jgi:hypothetical protein